MKPRSVHGKEPLAPADSQARGTLGAAPGACAAMRFHSSKVHTASNSMELHRDQRRHSFPPSLAPNDKHPGHGMLNVRKARASPTMRAIGSPAQPHHIWPPPCAPLLPCRCLKLPTAAMLSTTRQPTCKQRYRTQHPKNVTPPRAIQCMQRRIRVCVRKTAQRHQTPAHVSFHAYDAAHQNTVQ